MEKYEEIRYHIEVERKGDFNGEMDFLSENPKAAYDHLKYVQGKYKDRKIEITKITETTTVENLSTSDLETMANQH
jgi:hypothetical protein